MNNHYLLFYTTYSSIYIIIYIYRYSIYSMVKKGRYSSIWGKGNFFKHFSRIHAPHRDKYFKKVGFL